jgi:hypothetical protein
MSTGNPRKIPVCGKIREPQATKASSLVKDRQSYQGFSYLKHYKVHVEAHSFLNVFSQAYAAFQNSRQANMVTFYINGTETLDNYPHVKKYLQWQEIVQSHKKLHCKT